MSKRMILSWKGFLGAIVLLGGLAAVALLAQGRGSGATTSGLGGTAGVTLAATAAKTPVQDAVARAQTAIEEAATPVLQTTTMRASSVKPVATELPRTITKVVLSPEQAMDVVQKSGLDSSQVSSIDLTTDASGRQIYEVRNGGPNSAVLRVDVLTGTLLAPGK